MNHPSNPTPIYTALAASHGLDLDPEPPLHEEDA